MQNLTVLNPQGNFQISFNDLNVVEIYPSTMSFRNIRLLLISTARNNVRRLSSYKSGFYLFWWKTDVLLKKINLSSRQYRGYETSQRTWKESYTLWQAAISPSCYLVTSSTCEISTVNNIEYFVPLKFLL